jgi:hypothetical protein
MCGRLLSVSRGSEIFLNYIEMSVKILLFELKIGYFLWSRQVLLYVFTLAFVLYESYNTMNYFEVTMFLFESNVFEKLSVANVIYARFLNFVYRSLCI